MSDELRALPRDTPDYHARQAAHLRALAETARSAPLKTRLLKEAEQHESLALAEQVQDNNAPTPWNDRPN